jgi:D-alanyl-D-alanine carboxypeptidase/D-alanyl-D-alanine-endopeptidase (penicillin-binding protein 4)
VSQRAWIFWAALFALPAAAASAAVTGEDPRAWKKLRPSGSLPSRLQQLIKKGPKAQVGVQVYDLRRNRVVFAHEADRPFLPASNSKLLTTALALMRLGPDHQFTTRVLAEFGPDANGVLAGDLILSGGGDPSLTVSGGGEVEPVPAITDLANQVAARGVRRIRGRVIGDDTVWPWIPYGDGWTLDDSIWDYGAPVSALSVHGNRLTIRVTPGSEPGAAAGLMVYPPLEFLTFDNRVITVEGRQSRIRIERPPGSRTLALRGTIGIGSPGSTERVALDDPALAAAQTLTHALRARGVIVYGQPESRHREAGEPPSALPGVELARHTSPPLVELLRVVSKFSQNLSAEMILRETALQRRGDATPQNGLQEMEAFLLEIGIAAEDFRIEDGSGLSRRTLITPRAMTALLAHLHRSPHQNLFRSLLPVAGEPGTLRHRFGGLPARDRQRVRQISAKTGSLATAVSLSGYADSPRGPLAFALFVNNFTDKGADIRDYLDRLAAELTR